MKTIFLTALTACLSIAMALGQSPAATDAIEKEIRLLEQAQVDYLLQGDTLSISKRWSPDYVVNNPLNQVVNASQGPVRRGNRTYSSFTRAVERVLIHGQTVITMGAETVVPSGESADAGETIRRRFTDVWMNTTGNWLLVARHANVICQP